MDFTLIIVTIVTVAGSTGIWKFIEVWYKTKKESEQEMLTNDDGTQYRDDLKNRVRNLESLLAKSADEKDELRTHVLELTAEVNTLRVKVDFLEKENQRLKNV